VDFLRSLNSQLREASIPFFFEPNFNAEIAPLEAARRVQKDSNPTPEQIGKIYEPTVYGNFLLKKVRNNFAIGGGKYD
jgi:isopenicillin N synthase-like dioxygenase